MIARILAAVCFALMVAAGLMAWQLHGSRAELMQAQADKQLALAANDVAAQTIVRMDQETRKREAAALEKLNRVRSDAAALVQQNRQLEALAHANQDLDRQLALPLNRDLYRWLWGAPGGGEAAGGGSAAGGRLPGADPGSAGAR